MFFSVLFYAWFFYPIVLIWAAKKKTRVISRSSSQQLKRSCFEKNENGLIEGEGLDCNPNRYLDCYPALSIIIAAYNEEKHIGERIKNLLNSSYPRDKIFIRIGVDGSEDETATIAEQWALTHRNIKVYNFSERRGKISVLKNLLADASEEFLVFTDANTVFKPDALSRLINRFRDPIVGGVCGKLLFRGKEKEGFYWRCENRLKDLESNLDSCLGANGAIYAIRRELFWRNIPANTIVDDFVIGMKVREQGFRFVFEPKALAEEEYPKVSEEWVRRIRIGAGDYQALRFCRRCLLPKYGKFAWIFWSHKVLRWFTPHILIAISFLTFGSFVLVGTNGFYDNPKSWVVLWIALLFCLFNLICFFTCRISTIFNRPKEDGGVMLKFFSMYNYFLTIELALFCGFLRFCRGNLYGYWKRTER